ncbi:MAG: hypothetical protein NTW15_19460 [Burkholderiales bacterium]|nr:hypothetical protein [Burkholderiales bacterium]
MATPAKTSGFSFGKFMLSLLLIVLAVAALYFAVVLNWSYSSGERAGWVQKFSKKGWLCKTWEGEIALVSMPGAIPEKFEFTVTDEAVAEQINRVMGQRVSLHYEQKVGLPTTCFGETRYYVTRVLRVEDAGQGGASTPNGPTMPAAPPPNPPALPAPAAPSAPAPVPGAPAPAAEPPAAVPGLPSSGSLPPAAPAAGAPAKP